MVEKREGMMDASLLRVEDLHVSVEGKAILKGLSLTVEAGQIHALMGPNGSGKSTLSYALMGHPRYQVTQGRVLFKGEDLLALKPEERARRGVFLAFQYPMAVPGVSVMNFLRTALKSVRGKDVAIKEYRQELKAAMALLQMDETMTSRHVNDGFSGGEKKRLEILQMALLKPSLALLDETDSGLDIDALRIVSEGINALKGSQMGILLITHYQRVLSYVTPDVVHVLIDGRIERTGGKELALALEQHGYEAIEREVLATRGSI